jgi:hypothetical protein
MRSAVCFRHSRFFPNKNMNVIFKFINETVSYMNSVNIISVKIVELNRHVENAYSSKIVIYAGMYDYTFVWKTLKTVWLHSKECRRYSAVAWVATLYGSETAWHFQGTRLYLQRQRLSWDCRLLRLNSCLIYSSALKMAANVCSSEASGYLWNTRRYNQKIAISIVIIMRTLNPTCRM